MSHRSTKKAEEYFNKGVAAVTGELRHTGRLE